LLDLLFDIGPGNQGSPLTFAEIESWKRLTSVDLSGHEAELLRRLSAAYIGEYNQASDPNRISPLAKPMQQDQIKAVFKSIARSMKGK